MTISGRCLSSDIDDAAELEPVKKRISAVVQSKSKEQPFEACRDARRLATALINALKAELQKGKKETAKKAQEQE